MESCHVRIAGGEDAEKLLAIYAPYVENTAITFEYEVPSEAEFTRRLTEHTAVYSESASSIRSAGIPTLLQSVAGR